MKTPDLGLASVLQSQGFKLIALDRSDPARIQFCFDNEEGLDQVVAHHYQNQLAVSSLALLSNFKTLKSMIHQN